MSYKVFLPHLLNNHVNNIKMDKKKIKISKREIELLLFLNRNNCVINKKEYAEKIGKIPKTCVYDALRKLKNYGFIDYSPFEIKIKKMGFSFLSEYKDSLGGIRKNVVNNSLSSHYLRYKFKIIDKSKFSINRLNELNPLKVTPVKLINYIQYYVYFNNAVVKIDLNSVSIRIYDIVKDDVEGGSYEGFVIAMNLVDRLNKIGIVGSDISLPDGHYAKVESYLSDFLKKIDDKFYLELSDGHKFWIDNSLGKCEDETDSYKGRERIHNFLDDVMTSDVDLKDINTLKLVSKDLVKVASFQLKNNEVISKNIKDISSKLKSLVNINENTAVGVQALTDFLRVTQLNNFSNSKEVDGVKPDYFG